MALRSSGSDLPLIILAILLGVIVLAAKRVADSAVPAVFMIGLLASALGVAFTYSQARARRVGRLRAKYQDDPIVERIMSRSYWAGQTDEQLRDALGPPDSIEDQMTISRSRQAWTYGRRHIVITLDDGVVIAWNRRS